jgi:hypothetical protein
VAMTPNTAIHLTRLLHSPIHSEFPESPALCGQVMASVMHTSMVPWNPGTNHGKIPVPSQIDCISPP